jgi:oxamate amidohydrolase
MDQVTDPVQGREAAGVQVPALSMAAPHGMVTAPHDLAAQSGLAVLRDGGNAIEAIVAAAATIAVVYPHMNGIGGDGFWLIVKPGQPPIGIAACGGAARAASPALYADRGLTAIPTRGPLAANTVAGTIAGWTSALELSAAMGGRLTLDRLLADAVDYAERGFPTSRSQSATTAAKLGELRDVPGFAAAYTPEPAAMPGLFRQPRLGALLRDLARAGLDDFYRGAIARRIAADLARAGSPVALEDLAACRAERVEPLSLTVADATVYNLPPPTQGLASLLILGIFERLGVREAESYAHLHGLVEATKRAFIVRNAEVADPAVMRRSPADLLNAETIDRLARDIDPRRALPWPHVAPPGDTIWMGAIDREGCAVSFIQSLYWEFGSGVVLEDTGITWQNRGSSFSLQPGALNALAPGRRPFHTLNPAAALFDDGRTMVYGTMGGEGQPQTQAAIFTRHARFGQPLQQAIAAPRWLLGRTWGDETTTLKLEPGFDPAVVEALRQVGHAVEMVAPRNDLMGHAGALVRHADGSIDGATDPRSDGGVAGY